MSKKEEERRKKKTREELRKEGWSKEENDRGCREEKIWEEKRKGVEWIERNNERIEERRME